ncbi:GNAT family N-acetyltransferase [Actinoalloteichus spitiensis]|uniref:GNAT family N-acetyltransferase n=1 Tax=Actinoalloteichus spitiensis TaxID=252394 RepID=UPI000362D389|nr:GNAT family protein [Actinoalloteichus spitiensis]
MTEALLWMRSNVAAIGPIRPDLMETYWRWEQEIPTIVGYNRQTPQTFETTRDILYESYSRSSSHRIHFTIYSIDGQVEIPVGIAVLHIDSMRRTAEYVISLGARESRGRGVGSEASRLVLDYAFHVTNLRCVHLTVIESNAIAIRAYEKAGFKRQGLRRNSAQWLGETVNEVHMDAIPEDFAGPSLVRKQFEAVR